VRDALGEPSMLLVNISPSTYCSSLWAAEATVLARPAVVLAAVGADHVVVGPTRLNDCLSALVLGAEIGCERNEVIEL